MTISHGSTPRVFCIAALLFLVVGIQALRAQTKELLAWLEDLQYLQNAPAGEITKLHRVAQIRSGIELWLKLQPQSTLKLPPAPPEPWTVEQARDQVSLLRDTVEAILKQDPARPFDLGVTQVVVTAEVAPLSSVTDSIDHTEVTNSHITNVAQSVQYLPGVSVDRKSGRNQTGIMIRGFDTRQVGLYLDGIPIYVPYDGYADLGRFLTSDLAEIEVSKGYASPLLGPNGLGGAVNLVTREPERKLEGDASIGTGSGNGLESSFHVGSHWRQFFFRGGLDWLQSDFFPVSGDFPLNSLQFIDHRVNSYQRDARYSGRFAWTPRSQDEYVFTYATQKGEYGVPPYSGSDAKNNKVRYWQWPYWNRDSYYFNSNTGLGQASMLRFRAFYDHYPNSQNTYTDVTYSTLSNSLAYNDHSEGASSEFSTWLIPRQTLGGAFFFKDDTHRETSTAFSSGAVTPQPWRDDRDQQISIGLQDVIAVSSRVRATLGFSAEHLNALHAQDLKTTTVGSGKNAVTTYSIAPFSCPEAAAGADFTACLAHVWDYNPLASISYSLGESGTLFATFVEKSHFPTMKDRYSYKNGQAIPNPDLLPEHSRTWNAGYSRVFPFNTVAQVDLFRSDVRDAIENAIIPSQFPNQCPALPAGTCQESVNVGSEVHQGVEITIHSSPVSRLTVDANYSFLNRTISGPANMPGVYPTGTPKHKMVGTAVVRLPRRVLVLAAARYESGTITTNDSGLVVPASKFAMADLGGIVPIRERLSLHAGVKNIFDRNYYYQEGFPEAGRNWFIDMRYRF